MDPTRSGLVLRPLDPWQLQGEGRTRVGLGSDVSGECKRAKKRLVCPFCSPLQSLLPGAATSGWKAEGS